MTSRTRAADEYAEIRARMAEIEAERAKAAGMDAQKPAEPQPEPPGQSLAAWVPQSEILVWTREYLAAHGIRIERGKS